MRCMGWRIDRMGCGEYSIVNKGVDFVAIANITMRIGEEFFYGYT